MKLLVVSSDRTDQHGGACNLGDALLTDAMIAALERRGHQATAYDFGAPRTTADGPRLHGGRLRDLRAAIVGADAVVLGGGTMLQDDQPGQMVGGLPRLCAAVTAVARSARRPIRFFGVGCDTVDRLVPRQLLRLAVGQHPVWLREEESLARFRVMFGRSAHLAADAALLDRGRHIGAPLAASDTGSSRKTATLALNRTEAAMLTPEDVRALASGRHARFLSMDQQVGRSDAASLPPSVSRSLGYEPEVLGWREAAARIADSSVVVASRMHALYLAALLDVPMVAVGDREKVRAFAAEFDVPRVATVSDYEPGIERLVDPDAYDNAGQRASDGLDELLASLA